MTIVAPERSPIAYLNATWNPCDEACFEDLRQVAEFLRTHAAGGQLLDLGCGPTAAIWANLIDGVTECCAADIDAELHGFYQLESPFSDAVVESVALARLKLGLDARRFLRPNFSRWNIEHLNEDWVGRFESVIQIGAFGCLSSSDSLMSALCNAKKYVASGGVFISVTWFPRVGYEESRRWGGRAITHMSPANFEKCARDAGFKIEHVQLVNLDERDYQAVLFLDCAI